MRILIASGVNLDLLGMRGVAHYGKLTLEDIRTEVFKEAEHLKKRFAIKELQIEWFQTNSETAYLEKLSEKPFWDGMILNPGAWTHTSLALGDRLEALKIPAVEVHLSHVHTREDAGRGGAIRQHSFIAPHVLGVVAGFKDASYLGGLYLLLAALMMGKV